MKWHTAVLYSISYNIRLMRIYTMRQQHPATGRNRRSNITAQNFHNRRQIGKTNKQTNKHFEKRKKKKKKEKSSCIYSTSAPGFPLFTTSLFTMYKDLSATRTHTTTTVSAESSPLAAVKLFMQCECCCNCISIGYTQYVGFFQLTYKHLTRLFFCILFNSLSVVLMNYHFMMPGCCIVYTV